MRRNSERAERQAERRRREDEAPRLFSHIDNLASLRLEVEALQTGSNVVASKHVRHIVPTAPALFVLPCVDSGCDGGHDVTSAILRELRSGAERFEVEHACEGYVGNSRCNRMVRLIGIATYR
jgi:hypothetical protein